MKITANRETFSKAFQIVGAIASRKSIKPVYEHVRIDATKEGCQLSATDGEISIRHNIVEDLDVSKPGSALLPVGRLNSVLKESTAEELVINATTKKTVITGGGAKYNLQAMDPEEFPTPKAFDAESYFETTAAAMVDLIRKTIYATNQESARYALGGVYLEFGENDLIAVGTDGRRIAKIVIPVDRVNDVKPPTTTTIVPAKAASQIVRVIQGFDSVQFMATAHAFHVRTATTQLTTRLVEGRFPKWRDVFPTRGDSQRLEFPAGVFATGVRQAAVVASQDSRGIDFEFGEGKLVLKNTTADVGDSNVELVAPQAEPVAITLDNRFVLDFVQALDPEKVFTFDIKDANESAVFDCDNYSYVVMPLSR